MFWVMFEDWMELTRGDFVNMVSYQILFHRVHSLYFHSTEYNHFAFYLN